VGPTVSRELPPGWAMVKLGDVVGPFDVTDPKKRREESFRYVDIGCIDNRTHSILEPKTFQGHEAPSRARRVINENDVLFSTVRPYLKNIARVGPEYDGDLTSTGIAVLRPNEAIAPNFLFWTVVRDSFVNAINAQTDGSLYPAVRDSDLYEAEISLPPVNEQRRIVARIEELTARSKSAREALRAIPPLLEKFRQSLLAAAFRGDLTAEWRRQNPDVEPAEVLLERIRVERRRRWEESGARGKYVEPEPVDATGLPELPRGWCWARLANIVDGTPQNGLYVPQSAYGIGFPILRVEDYQVDSVREKSSLKQVRLASGEACKYALETGDLVVNRVNSPSHLGKTLTINEGLRGSLFESNLMRIRFLPNVSAEWVCYYLESAQGRARLTKKAKWAVNQASINQQDVVGTPIPLCCTREQVEAVRLFRVGSMGIRVFKDIMKKVSVLGAAVDSAILDKAFRGELVAQDPNDEPASQLLERIRAQKRDPPKTRNPRK